VTRERVDIAGLRHGVSLLELLPPDAKPRPAGARQWMARCSFHKDTRPSMSVRYVKTVGWTYRCFVCGVFGDVIRYFCHTRGLGFRDAVLKMAGGRPELLEVGADVDLPREMRTREPFVLTCEGRGCRETVGLNAQEVPLIGTGHYARELYERLQGWRFAKRWPEDARAWCGACALAEVWAWRDRQGWSDVEDARAAA
jgi:hypothetical protein